MVTFFNTYLIIEPKSGTCYLFSMHSLIIILTTKLIIAAVVCLWLHLIWGLLLMQVEPIRNMFAALFLASIGMLIHVHFLWNHVDILVASVILVVIVKTLVISAVVKGFGYNNKTSLLVRYYLVVHFGFSIYMHFINNSNLILDLCRLGCLWHK